MRRNNLDAHNETQAHICGRKALPTGSTIFIFNRLIEQPMKKSLIIICFLVSGMIAMIPRLCAASVVHVPAAVRRPWTLCR